MNKLYHHILVFIATLIISGSFLVSAALATTINPISITLLRFVFAVGCLLPFMMVKKNIIKQILNAMPRSLIISFFYSLFFILQFESLKSTTALNTSSIYSLVPFITAVLSFFIFKEFISKRSYFYYLLAGIGTIWVIVKGNINTLLTLEINYGDYLFLIASISMCCYSIAMKVLYRDDNMWVFVLCTLLGGCIWMSAFLLVTEIALDWHKLTINAWGLILYLGILATLGTSYLYQKSIITLGPRKVMSYVYLSPVLVVFISLLLFNQEVELIIYPGVILSGITTLLLLKKD